MIKDLLFRGKDVQGEVGIEIEVEGKNLQTLFDGIWKTEGDGSLRADEAYEYVLDQPVDRKDVKKSLQMLMDYWKENGCEIWRSNLAGTHVHINIRDLELKSLITFILLYYIFEESLVEYCGQERKGNHFCLRAKDAEYVLFRLEEALTEGSLNHLNTDQIRYSALNLKAICTYGSLEFRSMRSTPELMEVNEWVELLLQMKDYAIKNPDPRDLLKDFSVEGPINFAKGVFKDWEFQDVDIHIQAMYENMRRIQGIAFCREWDEDLEDNRHFVGEI